MTSELLSAIRRAPSDDAPRLAYAELLRARGDAHGEFIALECELSRCQQRHDLGDDYVAKTLRSWELWRKHRSEWLRAMGFVEKRGTWYRWERGFIHDVTTMAD